MPIQNILTLDKTGLNEDPKFKEYVLQSLANLGQRLAVKGDSIITRSFRFIDLFENELSDIKEDSVGCVEMINSEVIISLKRKSSLSLDSHNRLVVRNNNDTITVSTNIELTTPINGVKSYENGGLIITKNSEISLIFIGKNENNEYCEFIFDTFSKTSGDLLSGIRVCSLNGKNVLISVFKKNGEYDCSVREFDNSLNIQTILTNVNNVYLKNTKNIKNYNQVFWIDNIFKANKSIINFSIPFNDISNIEEAFILDRSKYSDLFNKYPDINTKLIYFVYDKSVFYPYAKEYYSNLIYTSNELDFREHIVASIFETVYNNQNTQYKLYFSLDYLFEYYSNSNNPWQIYGSVNNITVKYLNTFINKSNVDTYVTNDVVIAYSPENTKTALFNYFVTYDNDNQDVIYSINVEKRYTLPYINSNNLWVVDDNVTNIKAKAVDATNPNVVIVFNESKGTDTVQILSGATNKKIFEKLSWEPKTVYIQPLEQINLNDPKTYTESDLYILECKVPIYSGYSNEEDLQDFVDEFKNTLLVNMSSIYCLSVVDDNVINRYGRYGVITTLWILNEETAEFECIQNPYFKNDINNVALDINALTNLNNIITWHIENAELKHPDKYKHKWLVFENAVKDLKNNINDYQSYIYPVIMNNQAIDFATIDYENDMNLMIKYLDNISGAENNNITNVNSSYVIRYINSDTLETTSGIYTYISNSTKQYYNEFVPKENIPTLNLKEILVQNQNIVNRANVISFDRNGKMFYSYFGTSFNDLDKNKTIIGTATKNINVGLETMIVEEDNLFQKSTEVDINFENIKLNGLTNVTNSCIVDNNLVVKHIDWTSKIINNENIYYTQYTPISKIILDEAVELEDYFIYLCSLQFNNYNETNGLGDVKKPIIDVQMEDFYLNALKLNSNDITREDTRLFISCFYYNTSFEDINYLYIGEAIYIPALLKHIGLEQFIEKLSEVDLFSNREIVKYNDYPLFLITSNRFLSNVGSVEAMPKNSQRSYRYVTFENSEKVHIGNPLNISYKIYNNKLSLNINELESGCKFKNLFKIKTEYK